MSDEKRLHRYIVIDPYGDYTGHSAYHRQDVIGEFMWNYSAILPREFERPVDKWIHKKMDPVQKKAWAEFRNQGYRVVDGFLVWGA